MEGRNESEDGNLRRRNFIDWLNGQSDEDGASVLEWVEIQYGNDEGFNKVTNHNSKTKERLCGMINQRETHRTIIFN